MANAVLTFSADRQCFVSSLPGGTVGVNPPNWGGGILGGSCGIPTCCRLSGGGYDILERAGRNKINGEFLGFQAVGGGLTTFRRLARPRVEPNRPVRLATEQPLASQLLATTLMALADASALASVVTHKSHSPAVKVLGNKGRFNFQCVLFQIKVIGHVKGTVTLTMSVV